MADAGNSSAYKEKRHGPCFTSLHASPGELANKPRNTTIRQWRATLVPAIRPANKEIAMSVHHIQSAFSGFQEMGFVGPTSALRQCSRAYDRNPETRERLASRLRLRGALQFAACGTGLLDVQDDLGQIHTIEASVAALQSLSSRLRRLRPAATLSVANRQASAV